MDKIPGDIPQITRIPNPHLRFRAFAFHSQRWITFRLPVENPAKICCRRAHLPSSEHLHSSSIREAVFHVEHSGILPTKYN